MQIVSQIKNVVKIGGCKDESMCTSIRKQRSGNAVPAADFIKQAGEDFLKLGDEAKVQVTALREEINAKKSAEDELEKIYNGCKALLDME